MNYLALVQTVASESGVVPNAGPPGSASAVPGSLASATGIVLKMTAWVNQAWRDIQVSRRDWAWRRREFDAEIFSGQSRFSASDLSVTRFAAWIPRTQDGYSAFSIYKTTTGVSDEGALSFVPWEVFYVARTRGTQPTPSKPGEFSIDPDGELAFNPEPDDDYTIRGLYLRTAQALTMGSDEPEMPEDFHDLIWIRALQKADVYDEAGARLPIFKAEENRLWTALVHDQTEPIDLGGPLA